MPDRFCPAHSVTCKEIEDAGEEISKLKNNIYGEGPSGAGGVYGEIKRKVSYKALSVLLAFVSAIIGYFAYSTLDHRGRLVACETTLEALCRSTEKIANNQEIILQKIETFNNRQLRVMKQLELDPNWGK